MALDSISPGWVSVSPSKVSEFQPLWLAESGLLNGRLVGELEESTLMSKTHKPTTQRAYGQMESDVLSKKEESIITNLGECCNGKRQN